MDECCTLLHSYWSYSNESESSENSYLRGTGGGRKQWEKEKKKKENAGGEWNEGEMEKGRAERGEDIRMR